jgi:hypothetical protein
VWKERVTGNMKIPTIVSFPSHPGLQCVRAGLYVTRQNLSIERFRQTFMRMKLPNAKRIRYQRFASGFQLPA